MDDSALHPWAMLSAGCLALSALLYITFLMRLISVLIRYAPDLGILAAHASVLALLGSYGMWLHGGALGGRGVEWVATSFPWVYRIGVTAVCGVCTVGGWMT